MACRVKQEHMAFHRGAFCRTWMNNKLTIFKIDLIAQIDLIDHDSKDMYNLSKNVMEWVSENKSGSREASVSKNGIWLVFIMSTLQ